MSIFNGRPMLHCCIRLLPSVVDIVAKRCVLPKNCLKEQVENSLWGNRMEHMTDDLE